MYTLYYIPSSCSLATHVVLRELGQDVKLIDREHASNFSDINPVGSVPVLTDGDNTLTEGAAILMHLFNEHKNSMMPEEGAARQKAIQNILFANATMHPAYGRLFFIGNRISDESAKTEAFAAAAEAINNLWNVVEGRLNAGTFLGGDTPSAADIMLTVYSRWGAHFPVDITFGPKTTKLLAAVQDMPNFKKSIEAEAVASAQ